MLCAPSPFPAPGLGSHAAAHSVTSLLTRSSALTDDELAATTDTFTLHLAAVCGPIDVAESHRTEAGRQRRHSKSARTSFQAASDQAHLAAALRRPREQRVNSLYSMTVRPLLLLSLFCNVFELNVAQDTYEDEPSSAATDEPAPFSIVIDLPARPPKLAYETERKL